VLEGGGHTRADWDTDSELLLLPLVLRWRECEVFIFGISLE